jgi:hypothetical protein
MRKFKRMLFNNHYLTWWEILIIWGSFAACVATVLITALGYNH